MESNDVIRKIKEEVLCGSYELPFSLEKLKVGKIECLIPKLPNNVSIRNLRYTGYNYQTINESEVFDMEPYLKLTNELLNHINSPLLSNYEIEIEKVKEIKNKIPKDGKLDSLIIDNRIKIRPLKIYEVYTFDASVKYDELMVNYGNGVFETLRDKKVEVRNFNYLSPLKTNPISFGRVYTFCHDGAPLFIQRFPVWFNLNSNEIESIARIPLEVLSNLIEPSTSQLIDNDINEYLISMQSKKNKKGIQNEVSEGIEEIIKYLLYEERGLALGIVKSWLLKRSMDYKLDPSEIVNWEIEKKSSGQVSENSRIVLQKLINQTPKELIGRYYSRALN